MIEFALSEALFFAAGALVLGIIMLVRGGGWMIDASIYIARHCGIPPLLIGFTIIAFGTSLPELVVSVNANLSGLPGIAIGNVVGSNIANILMVAGATAAVSAIVVTTTAGLRRDLGVMLLASFLLAALMITDNLSRFAGIAMMLALIGYTLWQYWHALHDEDEGGEDRCAFRGIAHSLLFLIGGLVLIIAGAEFLVRGAKICAEIIGVPDAVIGLTIIAAGTSLPELTTCLIAAMKKQHGIVIGNVVGSNVFNILMIIGVSAAIKPIPASSIVPQLLNIDIWVMCAVSILFAFILMFGHKISRLTGVLFLCAYIGYVISVYALGLSGAQG